MEDEREPETDQEMRERRFNRLYYLSLALLGIVVVWSWISGGASESIGRIAIWVFFTILVLGLVNALGLFGRR